MITPEFCRAARYYLEVTPEDLARDAGICRTSLWRFENKRAKPHNSTVKCLEYYFTSKGIEFTDNSMVIVNDSE